MLDVKVYKKTHQCTSCLDYATFNDRNNLRQFIFRKLQQYFYPIQRCQLKEFLYQCSILNYLWFDDVQHKHTTNSIIRTLRTQNQIPITRWRRESEVREVGAGKIRGAAQVNLTHHLILFRVAAVQRCCDLRRFRMCSSH